MNDKEKQERVLMKTKVSGDSFCVMLEHDGLGADESHRDSGRYDGGTHYWRQCGGKWE